MKTILIIIGSILLAGATAAGGFYAGMTYQTNQANQIRANFMNARGMTDQGQNNFSPPSGTGQFQRGSGGFPGGGTAGQVKTVDGYVLTLSTAQNVTTVNLSDSTQIEKTVTGAISDLQPGMRVMVIGEKDSNGNITANRISILGDGFPGAPGSNQPSNPPPAGTTEP
jgi:Domain of unknown function (DUF5666)